MEKEYESEKKEPEMKKGSFLDKLLKHLRVDYWPDEEDEEIKVKRLWKCGTPMAYQQMREEEKKKNKYDSEEEEVLDPKELEVGKCGTPKFLQEKYSNHLRLMEQKKSSEKKKVTVREFLNNLDKYSREEYYMDDDWVPMKNSDGDFS